MVSSFHLLYPSGNAPCVTGYAAKKEGLGIGGPNQILITGAKDDNLTQQLLDVSATNGAVINSQVLVVLSMLGSLGTHVVFCRNEDFECYFEIV